MTVPVPDYEYPLPQLDISEKALEIGTKDIHTGKITIKNKGGGTLSGRILSRCPGLTFTPSKWEGNSQQISYTFTPSEAGLTPGQTLESRVYFTSNGGEKELPVSIKLTKMSISTKEGYTIANLRDFYKYAQIQPLEARKIFTDSEFYMLLLAIGYDYMEVYESLHKDANRERAMDNFFILSGLKGKTALTLDKYHQEFVKNPDDDAILSESLKIHKSDDGYIETTISTANNSPWLNLSKNRLLSSDFNEENTATINFTIDPVRAVGSYVYDKIILGREFPDKALEIVYRRAAPLILRLNRDAYRYEDKGQIEVINNTGVTMQVEVFCPESYIRFSARKYPIGAYGEIPFNIKLSAFMSAQLFFRKLPYMQTTIEIKAAIPGEVYKKRVPLIVGEW